LELEEHAGGLSPDQVKRNFRLGVTNGVLFILAETIFDPTLVLVGFMSNLTSSPFLLGLVVPIRDGAWSLPQLWVSGFLQNRPRKLPLYRQITVIRIILWAVLSLTIFLVRDPAWLLVTFFATYSLASFASGISGLPFLEVVGLTIPSRRRGEFFAWRLGLGGLAGIGGSLLVRFLLNPGSPLKFPNNFSLLGFLYFLLASVALIFFCMVKEGRDHHTLPRASLGRQLTRVRQILKENPQYRSYLSMQSMLMISGAAIPFFAVYVQRNFGGPKEMIGVYLAVYTVANLVANLFFGRLSYRYGNRRVMVYAAGAGLIMSLVVLALFVVGEFTTVSGMAASYLLVPVFFLSGLRGTGIGVSSNSLLLDLAPAEERSLYLGFSNTFLGSILLATGLSGLIISAFGLITFLAITTAAHLVALISVQRMKAFDYAAAAPENPPIQPDLG